jgi:ABC-type transport system involved in Fe-S cluster assembly fused permease/ATPase subunit
MINTYILQLYSPLGFLGTMWRFMRQSMVDVELVFELLEIDHRIKDPIYPEAPHIKGGEIEFRNVSFSYDDKNKPGTTDVI